jgi:hypothetical protein
MSGFSERDFARLFAILDDVLTKPKRGRKLAIGPMDSLLLIMHWLRKDALINAIAAAFHLRSFTLSNTLKKIAVYSLAIGRGIHHNTMHSPFHGRCENVYYQFIFMIITVLFPIVD